VSEEELSPPLRARWWESVVLVGGFERAWAAAVWGVADGEADDFIGELIEHNLLSWDEAGRVYCLHDLVRDYAASRLCSASRQEAERGHARYCAAAFSRADDRFPKGCLAPAEALRWFDRVWPDVQAGFAWARERLEGDEEAARLCCEYGNRSSHARVLRQHA